MAPLTLDRFVQELEKLKQEKDAGNLRPSEYDQRLARTIRELRQLNGKSAAQRVRSAARPHHSGVATTQA